MQEQTIEKSDATIGIECKVERHNTTQNRIRFKSSFANIGDMIVALTLSEHSNYLQQIQQVDEYIEKINQLQQEIDSNDIKTMEKQLAVYEKQVDKLNKSNNSYKQWNNEFKTTIEDLERKVDNYKKTIADKDATITSLTSENKKLHFAVDEQAKTISSNDSRIENLEQTIADLKEMNDKIAKQLEDSIDASEIEDLQEQVATLSDKLNGAESDATYWKTSYNNIIDSSDELANKNETLIAENEKLRNDNDAINKTNQLLNENIIGLKATFDETKQEMQSDFKNKEKESKETIKKMQSHIDELTDKYQSLLTKKEYIPPTSHYDEVLGLQQEIKDKENEIDKLNGEIEVKLATQKSELDSEHADEINNIKLEHANEKAQLLVAYNKELDNLKLQYNNLANNYNHLLDEVDTITKLNAIFDSRHKKIRKDKEHIPALEITSEQLPPSDEDVLEYVPKED